MIKVLSLGSDLRLLFLKLKTMDLTELYQIENGKLLPENFILTYLH